MRIGRTKLVILVVLSCAFVVLGWLPLSESQEECAKFTQVKYNARIRSGKTDTWTFTIYNVNRSENDQGAAQFFLKFYVDDSLYFDEYDSTRYKTWPCNKGETVSHSYQAARWPDILPATRNLRIELFWFYNGTSHLEDTALFTVGTTVLMSLQHIYATGYLAVYLLACFVLLTYDYVVSLEE